MSHTLQKLATFLISPLGTTLILWLLSLVALHTARPRLHAPARWLAITGLLWLWLWSTPLAAEALARQIEQGTGPRRVQDTPTADVIVVLGGALRPAREPDLPYPDMGAGADRVWHAARLYHAGKAPFILASGGNTTPGAPPEAAAIRDLLRNLGVPAPAIVLEGQSLDTVGNATYSAQIIRQRGWQRVLLVTSALHMPRAMRIFREAGIQATPAPTDIEAPSKQVELHHLIPTAAALDLSARAVKELAGMIYDR